MRYNQDNYRKVFEGQEDFEERVKKSETEPSLSDCVEAWLERTPGLEKEGFDFPRKFQAAVEEILKRDLEEIDAQKDETVKSYMVANFKFKKENFDSIFSEKLHEEKRRRGDRRFSHKALLGAIMINLYKEEPRFHQPSLLMELLMDLEVEITKWRCELVLLPN